MLLTEKHNWLNCDANDSGHDHLIDKVVINRAKLTIEEKIDSHEEELTMTVR